MDEENAAPQQQKIDVEILLAQFTVFAGTCMGLILGISFAGTGDFRNAFLVLGATLLLGTIAFSIIRIIQIFERKNG